MLKDEAALQFRRIIRIASASETNWVVEAASWLVQAIVCSEGYNNNLQFCLNIMSPYFELITTVIALSITNPFGPFIAPELRVPMHSFSIVEVPCF